MDATWAVESEKIGLMDELDHYFAEISIDTLTELVAALDDLLIDYLKRLIVKYATPLFGAEVVDKDAWSFHLKEAKIVVEKSIDLKDERHLVLGLLVRNLETNRTQRKKRHATRIDINGWGRYSSVVYDFPDICTVRDENLLTKLTKDVFVVGYHWMNEKTVSCIRRTLGQFNQSLYEHMRIIVPNEKLLDGFIFSAVYENNDFVVLNDFAISSALLLAEPNAWKLGRSAADVTIQMMTQVIPIEDSVIMEAVKNENSVVIDLSKDRYYQADDTFSDALRAVWGDSITCFPIVKEGDFLLVAFFITCHKDELEPMLIVHKQRLQQLAKDKSNMWKKGFELLSKVKARAPNAAVLGEFAGGFVGGLAHILEHHH